MEPNGILIYGELDEHNEVRPVVKQLISKARQLKEKIWNQRIMVCVIGPRINYDRIMYELGIYGADDVIIVCDNRIFRYDSNIYPEIFKKIAEKYPPRIILTGATVQGKAVASYTATKLETGLTADCTDININEYSMLVSTRPTFGGKLTADILCKTFPQMATVQENVFKSVEIDNRANAIFDWQDIGDIEQKTELIKTVKKEHSSRDVAKSEIVIAGGLGACKDNGFALIYQLAQKMGAAVGGSREAFEKSYIIKSQQIGQTGKTIASKIYIAVGISGANQHLAGIKNCDKIIAINNDVNAPIFKYADIGIVGNLFEVLPDLIEKYDTVKIEEKNE